MARSRSSAAFCRDCCEQAASAAAMRAALSAGTSAVRIVFSPRPARANIRGREHTRTVARRSRPGVEGLLMWKAILAIGLGGALGALLRWWLGLKLNAYLPAIPPGTLAANLIRSEEHTSELQSPMY